jgi:hypothetical protein
MHWCEQNLSLFHQTKPIASDFLTFRGAIIPDWYPLFLYHTRAHVATNQDPILALPVKLDDTELATVRQRIVALQEGGYNLNGLPE